MTKPDPAIIKSLFDLYRAGEYRTLLEQAQALLETWPDEPALHSLAGSACLEMQDHDAAIRSYRAALAIRPDLAKVHNSLGIACLRSGQVEDAANSFHNAVRYDSQFAQAWFNLGIVYENRNRLAEAAGYYKQATLINPVYHQALCSLAKVLWELRIPDQVEEYFEKAVAIEENYLPAHVGLLRFLEQSNRHEKLREALSRARKVPARRKRSASTKASWPILTANMNGPGHCWRHFPSRRRTPGPDTERERGWPAWPLSATGWVIPPRPFSMHRKPTTCHGK